MWNLKSSWTFLFLSYLTSTCPLINCLLVLGYILLPFPTLLGIIGDYISQASSFSGFWGGSANGSQCQGLEVGRKGWDKAFLLFSVSCEILAAAASPPGLCLLPDSPSLTWLAPIRWPNFWVLMSPSTMVPLSLGNDCHFLLTSGLPACSLFSFSAIPSSGWLSVLKFFYRYT